jgi:glycosyltransferase involved in cell wall biosynthesis
MSDFVAGQSEHASGTSSREMPLRTAVLIPCLNEGAAIRRVVEGFTHALPGAAIYVYDNGSTDDTVAQARAAGAQVRFEPKQGKGNVVRRMFADVSADVYFLVDGDGTYDASSAPRMLAALTEQCCDMVNARRVATESSAYRPGHSWGNRALAGVVSWLFGKDISDLLSGYRVFSRRFVKSFPALSGGFEIETELTVHALELRMAVAEIDTPYFARIEGSSSKLSTFRDGLRIALTILKLLRDERPLSFFGLLGVMFAAVSLYLGVGLWITFIETGLVPKLPTAVLATGLMLSALFSVGCGLILDTVTTGRREMKRLHYLRFDAVDTLRSPPDQ